MRSLLAALILVPALASADVAVLQPGDALPVLNLNDQHDKPYALPDNTRVLLVTSTKPAGAVANEVLKVIPQMEQERRGIVYIADVSGMPGLVTTMFALPKMRDYGYRIMVGTEPDQTAMLPRAEDAVTLIQLEQGKIKAIEKAGDAEALKVRLDAIAP